MARANLDKAYISVAVGGGDQLGEGTVRLMLNILRGNVKEAVSARPDVAHRRTRLSAAAPDWWPGRRSPSGNSLGDCQG